MLNLWRDVGRDTRWIMWSYMLWGVGEGLWLYIQPLYVKSLGANPEQTGFVLGMVGLARLLFMLPVGMLADRLGARRLMLPGWFVGLTGALLIALAPDWRWAVPGFLVYGISSVEIPVTNVYLSQSVRHDPTRRPDLPIQASLTLLWAAYSLGLVVSPAVGGWIGDEVGLRPVFLFSLFWFALSAAAITRTHDYPAPVRPERGHDYRGLLSRGPVIAVFCVLTLGFMAIFVGQSLSAQYLEEVRNFSRTSIGVFGSINALGTAVFSVLLGLLVSWRAFRSSLLLVMLSFGLLVLSGAWPVVVIASFILGAHYAARPLAVSVISGYVAEHQRGLAYSLVDMLAGLAMLVGTSLAGVLYTGSPDWPFAAGMVGIVGVVILGAALLRPAPARNRETIPAYTGVEQASE